MAINKRVFNPSEITMLEPNYDGIAKVLSGFVQLYKVANDKSIVDECLKQTIYMVSGEPIVYDKSGFDRLIDFNPNDIEKEGDA